MEQFAAEQAAAEGGELAPLLAEAGTQTAAEAAAFPIAEGLGMAAGVATGGAAALAGGAAYGLYRGGCWLLSGNGGEFQDVRTLNGMQQGAPQERISVRQPRVHESFRPNLMVHSTLLYPTPT